MSSYSPHHSQTPRSQRVRIAGKVDAIHHGERAFTLVLDSGEQIPVVLVEGGPEVLAPLLGKVAVVSGTAEFHSSGSLRCVNADLLQPGSEQDLSLWSEMPQPLFGATDVQNVRPVQGPRSGINAIIGMWPGGETDDEIFAMLEEMS